MAFYTHTGKSLVVFGGKHGSTSIASIIRDLQGKETSEARNTFKHWNRNNEIPSKILFQEDFKNILAADPTIPVFIFIRNAKIAALSAWLEDVSGYLEQNHLRCIVDIPEMFNFIRSLDIQENYYPPNSLGLDLRSNHENLSDEVLKNLLLALTEKMKPFFDQVHFRQNHLDLVISLLELMTDRALGIEKENIFILDLDNYDHSADNLLVEYRIVHKEMLENEDFHFKNSSTKPLAKRVEYLFDELVEQNFFIKYRLVAESLGYNHIHTTYDHLLYTPQRFENFIKKSKKIF
jgi:hypothetical protein